MVTSQMSPQGYLVPDKIKKHGHPTHSASTPTDIITPVSSGSRCTILIIFPMQNLLKLEQVSSALHWTESSQCSRFKTEEALIVVASSHDVLYVKYSSTKIFSVVLNPTTFCT